MRVSVWVVALVGVMSVADAQTPAINIKFGSLVYTGPAVIGAGRDKWNNVPSATITNLPLTDTSGAATTATLTCSGNGVFSSLVFGFSSTPYATLMGEYLYS